MCAVLYVYARVGVAASVAFPWSVRCGIRRLVSVGVIYSLWHGLCYVLATLEACKRNVDVCIEEAMV